MASSLAEQLAKGAAHNANILSEKTRKQAASESYLFSPKEAREHDLDSLFALGHNGFLGLQSLQPELGDFEDALFSEYAKTLDRSLQTAEQNAQLDEFIATFLPLLGPFLLDAPTGKVLEWLVRRFRIHEFNVESIVSLFLPYHETPHFTKMASILHLSDRSPLRFLIAYKATVKTLHRPLLINDMLSKPEVARFVAGILPVVLKQHGAGMHRALTAFHTGALLEYVAKSKSLDENDMLLLLPAAMEPLQVASAGECEVKRALLQETILGSFLILAAISQKAHLTSKAVKSMLAAVVHCAERVTPKQLIRTLVSICAPQDQVEKLSGSLTKTLITIPGIDVELTGAMVWVGAEHFMCPLIDGLLSRVDNPIALAVVESVLTSHELIPSVAQSASSALVRHLVGANTPERASETLSMRQLLSQLHQRHPKAVQAASRAILDADGDRDAIEQLMLSITMPVTESSRVNTETATLAVGSTDINDNVRAKAVRDLVSRLSDDDVPEHELQSISSILLLRVHDTSTLVVQALYNTSAEAATRALITHATSPTAYIDALKQALHGPGAKPSRDVIRAHLTFLLTHFLPNAVTSVEEGRGEEEGSESEENRNRSRRVFMDIILPVLLYSKPRMKTAQAVWEILEAAETTGSEVVSFELLGGCVEAVRWEQARPAAPVKKGKHKHGDKEKEGVDTDLLTKINLAVAAKIADNILVSNYLNAHLDLLLEKLHDESTYARPLAYLVTRALLNRLSGDQRVEAGHRVLQAMRPDTLEGMGDFMRDVEDVGTFLDDTSVGTAVVAKPNSQNTLYRLQVAVLSVLPNFPRPPGVSLEWIAEYPSHNAAVDDRAARYIQLLRSVYHLSNSSASLPLLSTHLLRTLFIKLGDDALSFLAGIWLSAASHSSSTSESEAHIQYSALRHAGAFLEAHVATERTVDFQTVLPAMLVMLQSGDASVREAAVRCIAVVIKLSFAKEAEAVYAFDAIYGEGSAKLQYLDWADLHMYTRAVGETRNNLLHDPEYLKTFHREHLAQRNGDSKKTVGYKRRVLCYLLSHVNGCPLLTVKVSLLKSVETVSNVAKSQVLAPTIDLILRKAEDGEGQQYTQLATLAVSTFDDASTADLNDPNQSAWDTYEKVFLTCLKSAKWTDTRTALLYRLEHGLFSKLNIDRKTQLCRTLLRIGAEDESLALICKKSLGAILSDVSLIIRLLVLVQPQSITDPAAQPANKRPRVDTSKSYSTAAGQELLSLVILAEIVGSVKLTGSLELISCLLETLNKVMNHTSPDVADRRFMEQLLMSAIENVVQNFPSSVPVPPGSVRVDTLVEILRTSENPQTFHQACLLMASLARLAPDAVLHNVMPVFTFMGSNVFHRDDTYSFRVVQKTIDAIVPVMVASLKQSHGSGMDLYLAARDFLRVFTNAANHVPRHRRVHFFSHVVDTLGPADFLAPVTMHLVDRKSSRVVRQNAAESSASLFLPLAVCERYTAELQLALFVQLVREVRRLVHDDSTSESPFLEDLPDDEHADVTARRRAGALLVFCDHALKRLRTTATAITHTEGERAFSRDLLASLLAVATAHPDDASYGDIAVAARLAMASTLGIMSAQDFVTGIITIIQSSSINAQAGALELLGERLTEVAESARRTLTPSIVNIIEMIRNIMPGAQDTLLVRSALHALTAISNTLAPGEEGAVTTTVPLILNCLEQHPLCVSALQTLLAFSTKLGPRMIPFLKRIVKECVMRSREAISGDTIDAEGLVPIALNVLRKLLTSISTFWGEPEVLQVIEFYLDSSSSHSGDSAEMSLLIKTTAKRTSPSVLLPALCHLWSQTLSSTAQEQLAKTMSYMRVVKAAIKAASRAAVLENLRELYKTFLSIFDFAARSGDAEVESTVTSAFVEVVVKLNEAAFRPLFRKLFDWAFAEGHASRKTVFCHVYTSLLDLFKALMVPYMSFAWQVFQEHLKPSGSKTPEDGPLWLAILQTLSTSLSADEDRVFWRSDKLRQLVPLAIQQVPVAIELNVTDGKTAVAGCLVALLGIVDDDVMAKSLNLNVLMHSRADDARVRLFGLSCAEQLWRAHGDQLLGFVAETATFIAEAAEDENDSVVQEAHKLKAAVEGIGGSIDVS